MIRASGNGDALLIQDFVNLLAKLKIPEAECWLRRIKRSEGTYDFWNYFRDVKLTSKSIIELAKLVADRIMAKIQERPKAKQRNDRILFYGHKFLREICKMALKKGFDVSFEQIDGPITLQEVMEKNQIGMRRIKTGRRRSKREAAGLDAEDFYPRQETPSPMSWFVEER